jgi:hypothetical protein
MTSKSAPKGKFRVIGVDLFSHEDYLVGDHEKSEAFDTADSHNKKREGEMDDVYYVYDDKGLFKRGPAAVSEVGVAP